MIKSINFHRTQRFQLNILVAAVFAVLIALLASSNLFAQTKTNTANTLKVSPVRTDIEIQPGMSKVVRSIVTNLTDAPITVSAIENDFIAGDERGTPALILDENKYAPSHSLKRFMKPLSDVTIPAKKSKTVNVLITVPKNARAGGYFGAVRFAPTSPDSGGQVNLSASVTSLILMTVPGKVNEKLTLTDLSVQQAGTTGQFFTGTKDLSATVRFKSESDVQLGPFGKVSVKKGDKVIYETDFNNKNPRDVILPDSARRWDIPLSKVDGFGEYTVNATFTYGKKNQTIEVTKSFWIIPWNIIIAVLAGLLILIGIIVLIIVLVRRRRRRTLRGRFGRR